MGTLHLSICFLILSLFTQYFLVSTAFQQRYFSFLVFLWRSPCIATGPMLLSLEPETTSWRIPAAGGKWGPPLQQLNLPVFTDTFRQRPKLHVFLLIKKIKGRHLFIPEKHSKAFHLPRTPQMEAVCCGDPAYLFTPPL